MPVPYLGSKRSNVGKIYSAIKNLNTNSKLLVDLFCGGFAISEYFIKQGWSVISNDKNKYIIALLKKTIFEGLDEKEVTKFITRERFIDVLENKYKYEDWYIGFVMCIWSFGNNQRAYLFGKEVEPYKKAGNELVINKNESLIKKVIPNMPQKYIDGILGLDNWHKRRLALSRASHKLKTRILELQRLERLQQLEQLQRLERLQQLQQLQQLERLERLQFLNCDYRDIIIPKDAVVYCDPPYQGTEEYAEGNFNHKEFWEWVRKQSKINKIYISEYNAPEDFKKVLSFSRNSTYAGGNNKNQPKECLFIIK